MMKKISKKQKSKISFVSSSVMTVGAIAVAVFLLMLARQQASTQVYEEPLLETTLIETIPDSYGEYEKGRPLAPSWDSVSFSPSGRAVGYRVRIPDSKMFLQFAGAFKEKIGPGFFVESSPRVGEETEIYWFDDRSFAYVEHRVRSGRAQYRFVVGGRPQQWYRKIYGIQVDANTGRYVYVAEDSGRTGSIQYFLIVDGKEKELAGKLLYGPKFTEDSRLLYGVYETERVGKLVLESGEVRTIRFPTHDKPRGVYVCAQGMRWAYVEKSMSDLGYRVVVDGAPDDWMQDVGQVSFSDDCSTYAYSAAHDDQLVAVIDGVPKYQIDRGDLWGHFTPASDVYVWLSEDGSDIYYRCGLQLCANNRKLVCSHDECGLLHVPEAAADLVLIGTDYINGAAGRPQDFVLFAGQEFSIDVGEEIIRDSVSVDAEGLAYVLVRRDGMRSQERIRIHYGGGTIEGDYFDEVIEGFVWRSHEGKDFVSYGAIKENQLWWVVHELEK